MNKDKGEHYKKYGVVAVTNGDGIDKIFKDIGADETINSKCGQNPSSHDFLEAARRVNSEHVFIFPNNSNFILSAEQAAKMEKDFSIHVIPSNDIALGYTAFSTINFECESTEEITRAATKAMNHALSGSIFTAARDTKCGGIRIKKGDVIGTIGKTISLKAKDSIDCAVKLAKKLLENRYVLTIFKGEEAKGNDLSTIEKRIKKSCPEAEIYVIDSGQDVFEYIFSAE